MQTYFLRQCWLKERPCALAGRATAPSFARIRLKVKGLVNCAYDDDHVSQVAWRVDASCWMFVRVYVILITAAAQS